LLECEVLSNRVVWGSSNWEAVPDIWRTTAEKYGNQIAVVDPYHDPLLQLTYKQVTFPSLPPLKKSIFQFLLSYVGYVNFFNPFAQML